MSKDKTLAIDGTKSKKWTNRSENGVKEPLRSGTTREQIKDRQEPASGESNLHNASEVDDRRGGSSSRTDRNESCPAIMMDKPPSFCVKDFCPLA
ncbi:hypothetical protein KM043_011317 [Ampulex compressa]|nr:hypothetical protein KM043_011317 [Ampulex compressa]